MPEYAKMPVIDNPNRQWPSGQLSLNPAWCAVDLRDGNQALPNPMTPDQKKEYFKLLLDIGFKEIEIGFPSASEDDFNFCRTLIDENLIPDDVTISVLTQSRSHLVSRTIEAVKGAKNVVIHAYIATSDLHMKYVFNMTRSEVIETAVNTTLQIKEESRSLVQTGSRIGYEFSPEEWSDTDMDFGIEICEKVAEAWGFEKNNKIIINLPMTVERRMPNEFADMVEIFLNKYKYRKDSVISVHVHNDMGCAVAATTLAVKAGADRVEGTLLGHGERTGNLDLITLAMNFKYLGINTGLDFSNLPAIVSKIEEITGINVHPRHPYSGELVFTAFSGSHQDAINKGFTQKENLIKAFKGWKIPYLHIAPDDIGRSFEKFIRINSQSGKGGVAFVLNNEFNIVMPKWVQKDFASVVQNYTDKHHRELNPAEVKNLFDGAYINSDANLSLVNYWPLPDEKNPEIIHAKAEVRYRGEVHSLMAEGNGPISALVNALKKIDEISGFTLEDYFEDSMGHSADAEALCFVSIKNSSGKQFIGGGIHANVIIAASRAIVNSINKMLS
ncbi:MAG: 2-isopropylmalate synthase [Spirochaetes bacterium]|nr:2-isopropylmalate synthase [Spirochaetota bacterium]